MFNVSQNLIAWAKIQLIHGLNRYIIATLDLTYLKDEQLFRARIRIHDEKFSATFEGMAEGETALIAKLKALAEAYERLCLLEFEKAHFYKVRRDLPYGLGVGFRKHSAQGRCWGEYFERRLFCTEPQSNVDQIVERNTPRGKVYLCRLTTPDGLIGTGYGLTRSQAKSSAQRSALRKRDFQLKPVKFLAPDSNPVILRITPASQGWLECYFLGFTTPNDSDVHPKS